MGFFQDHGSDGEVPKSRLYHIAFTLPGTIAAGVASGAQTVTPSNMYGIEIGTVIAVSDANGSDPESVTVTATAPTTFTATFASSHDVNCLIAVPIPVYWTDYDIDIVWDGHTWVAQPITASLISHQPDGDSGTFKIADADDALFPLLAANNGGELSSAAVYEAGFLTTNRTAVPDEVLQIFSGVVDRCEYSTATEDNITIVLMPPVQSQSGMLPTRLVTSLVRVT